MCEVDYIELPHLRAWREVAGLSQWDLSVFSGVDVRTISAAEHGRPVRAATASRLAGAIGCQKYELLLDAPPDVLPGELVGARPLRVIERADGLWFDVPAWRLRWARREKALSKYELARRAGLSARDIRAYEGGELLPAGHVARLASALGMSQLELLGCHVAAKQRPPARPVAPAHPRLQRTWLLSVAKLADSMERPAAARRFRRQAARCVVGTV